MTLQEKYAYLQQTAWTDMQSTTFGHIGTQKESEIEAAYEQQIASEAGGDSGNSVPDDASGKSETGTSDNDASGSNGLDANEPSPEAPTEQPSAGELNEETDSAPTA